MKFTCRPILSFRRLVWMWRPLNWTVRRLSWTKNSVNWTKYKLCMMAPSERNRWSRTRFDNLALSFRIQHVVLGCGIKTPYFRKLFLSKLLTAVEKRSCEAIIFAVYHNVLPFSPSWLLATFTSLKKSRHLGSDGLLDHCLIVYGCFHEFEMILEIVLYCFFRSCLTMLNHVRTKCRLRLPLSQA